MAASVPVSFPLVEVPDNPNPSVLPWVVAQHFYLTYTRGAIHADGWVRPLGDSVHPWAYFCSVGAPGVFEVVEDRKATAEEARAAVEEHVAAVADALLTPPMQCDDTVPSVWPAVADDDETADTVTMPRYTDEEN